MVKLPNVVQPCPTTGRVHAQSQSSANYHKFMYLIAFLMRLEPSKRSCLSIETREISAAKILNKFDNKL